MSNTLVTLLLGGVSAALFILCDSLSAVWAKQGSMRCLITVLILGPLAYFFFALVVTRKNLAVSSGMVNSLVTLGGIVVGIMVFGEAVSMRQGVGLVLAVVAVALLST